MNLEDGIYLNEMNHIKLCLGDFRIREFMLETVSLLKNLASYADIQLIVIVSKFVPTWARSDINRMK